MNRQQRRSLSQQRLKEKITRNVQEKIQDKVLEQQAQQFNDDRVETMMMCFVLALHRKFKFGKKRCMDALKEVDDLMGGWINDEYDLEKFRQLVFDETGIKIHC